MQDQPLRILLVRPHSQLLVTEHLKKFLHLEPLELEVVAGGVPDEDQVFICDLSLEKDPLGLFRRELQAKKPHIIGLTGYSTQAAIVKKLAHIAKTIDPSATVIVGGIHATIAPADYAIADIDIIVRGEGGTAIREIIRRFKRGEPLYFGQVALSVKDPGFEVKASTPPAKFPRPGDIPRPRRDLVQRTRYFSVWTSSPEKKLSTIFPRIATIRTSYGCAFSCSFCVVPYIMHSEYLQRTPEDVVAEIEGIGEDYIYFVDDETFLNANRMTEIANLLIERGIKKKFVSWARSDTIISRPELFKLWKKVGLGIVYVGLEAMDDKRLGNYEKRTTVETNRKAVSILRELDIILHASFMVDPNFSLQDFRGLEKEVLNVLPAEVSFTVFSPSPGSALWYKHKADFICADPYLFYDCFHTLLPTKLDIKTFYQHFARLYTIGWRGNPLRINKVRVPFAEVIKSIIYGTKYIMALKKIYQDYPSK